jgi:hypothetical protein
VVSAYGFNLTAALDEDAPTWLNLPDLAIRFIHCAATTESRNHLCARPIFIAKQCADSRFRYGFRGTPNLAARGWLFIDDQYR